MNEFWYYHAGILHGNHGNLHDNSGNHVKTLNVLVLSKVYGAYLSRCHCASSQQYPSITLNESYVLQISLLRNLGVVSNSRIMFQ